MVVRRAAVHSASLSSPASSSRAGRWAVESGSKISGTAPQPDQRARTVCSAGVAARRSACSWRRVRSACRLAATLAAAPAGARSSWLRGRKTAAGSWSGGWSSWRAAAADPGRPAAVLFLRLLYSSSLTTIDSHPSSWPGSGGGYSSSRTVSSACILAIGSSSPSPVGGAAGRPFRSGLPRSPPAPEKRFPCRGWLGIRRAGTRGSSCGPDWPTGSPSAAPSKQVVEAELPGFAHVARLNVTCRTARASVIDLCRPGVIAWGGWEGGGGGSFRAVGGWPYSGRGRRGCRLASR